jgi:hypothetical protein
VSAAAGCAPSAPAGRTLGKKGAAVMCRTLTTLLLTLTLAASGCGLLGSTRTTRAPMTPPPAAGELRPGGPGGTDAPPPPADERSRLLFIR